MLSHEPHHKIVIATDRGFIWIRHSMRILVPFAVGICNRHNHWLLMLLFWMTSHRSDRNVSVYNIARIKHDCYFCFYVCWYHMYDIVTREKNTHTQLVQFEMWQYRSVSIKHQWWYLFILLCMHNISYSDVKTLPNLNNCHVVNINVHVVWFTLILHFD